MNNKYQYFTEKDFQNAIPSCSLSDMNEEFMVLLDKIRKVCDFPFIINSAYRSEDYEKKRGRNGTSSHTKGVAVDLQAVTDRHKFLIVQTALANGITRIGVGTTFVHLDVDKNKTQNVIWSY
jgi:uncharacterized protein YcbK (DUF882 family)